MASMSDLKVHISVDTTELDEALRILSNSVSNFALKAMIRDEVKRQMDELEQRIRVSVGIIHESRG